MRFYGFNVSEIIDEENPFLAPDVDPKANWALNHLDFFPVEVNLSLIHICASFLKRSRAMIAERTNFVDGPDARFCQVNATSTPKCAPHFPRLVHFYLQLALFCHFSPEMYKPSLVHQPFLGQSGISKAESEKHLETTGHQPGHRWIPSSIFSVQKREKARGYKPLTW